MHRANCAPNRTTDPNKLVILDPGSEARLKLVGPAVFPAHKGRLRTGLLDTGIRITAG